MKLLFAFAFLSSTLLLGSTDYFTVVGTDTTKPRANYTVGVAHEFSFLKPIGNELIATYSYSNDANHGFLATRYGANSVALGLERGYKLPFNRWALSNTIRGGLIDYTGSGKGNRGFTNGTVIMGYHLKPRWTLSGLETCSKVETKRVYFTSGIALAHGWWALSVTTNRTSGNYIAHVSLNMSLSALMSGEHKHHPRIVHTTR